MTLVSYSLISFLRTFLISEFYCEGVFLIDHVFQADNDGAHGHCFYYRLESSRHHWKRLLTSDTFLS